MVCCRCKGKPFFKYDFQFQSEIIQNKSIKNGIPVVQNIEENLRELRNSEKRVEGYS